MDREMWILRQLETSLTASAEALAERLQVSPRTITNAINTLNRMLAPAASVRPTGGRYRLYILDPQEYSQIRSRLVRATDSLNDPHCCGGVIIMIHPQRARSRHDGCGRRSPASSRHSRTISGSPYLRDRHRRRNQRSRGTLSTTM